MRETDSDKQPIDRLATGIRMATVVVVLGTLAAVWHPGWHSISGGKVATSAPPATAAPPGSADTTYFPSRFSAPDKVEPQAPTF